MKIHKTTQEAHNCRMAGILGSGKVIPIGLRSQMGEFGDSFASMESLGEDIATAFLGFDEGTQSGAKFLQFVLSPCLDGEFIILSFQSFSEPRRTLCDSQEDFVM